MTEISFNSMRLEALLESAQLLNSSLDLDSLLKHLLRTVMGRTLVGRGFVAVEADGAMRYAQMRGLKTVKIGDVYDAKTCDELGIHHVYSIGDAANPTGLLGIGRPPTGAVAPDEEESLKALLAIAASSLANAIRCCLASTSAGCARVPCGVSVTGPSRRTAASSRSSASTVLTASISSTRSCSSRS